VATLKGKIGKVKGLGGVSGKYFFGKLFAGIMGLPGGGTEKVWVIAGGKCALFPAHGATNGTRGDAHNVRLG
jgi:hypothetical protein